MKIEFSNDLQVYVAQLLWEADSMERVEELLSIYGKDAEVAYSMILAETFDSCNETDLAEKVIQKVK